MTIKMSVKKLLMASAAVLALGALVGVAANKYNKPASVLHIVTFYYKDGTTPEQKKAVVDGVEKMAAEIPGVKNVWLKGTKVQGTRVEKKEDGTSKTSVFTDAFVMEFESDAAFKAYADHAAHRAWEKLYLPVRGYSTTHTVTNQ